MNTQHNLSKTGITIQGNEWSKSMKNGISLKRFGQAQEIAKAALFFASRDSSYITGVELPVDGGITQATHAGKQL